MIINDTNGYIRYSIEDDEVIIELVAVKDKRKGTGSMLVNKVIDIAIGENKPCTLCAYPQDDSIELSDLVSFYDRLGFVVEYDDGNAVLMRR